ncbi:MAG: hypothetical protein AB1758_36205, partial [Candidatus Eremiobacterota bacterium]
MRKLVVVIALTIVALVASIRQVQSQSAPDYEPFEMTQEFYDALREVHRQEYELAVEKFLRIAE